MTAFLCLFSLCLCSCKKNSDALPNTPLTGDWREVDLKKLSRSLKFKNDNSFYFSVGITDGSNTMYTGNYQVKGDSLKVKATEMLVQEPGKAPQKSVPTLQLYERATFIISADTLTLKYITYPADGPVLTTAKFYRMTTID